MNDVVVSVRLPKNLVVELKKLATLNHYMDLSEQIRDIIREKSIQKLYQFDQPKHETQPTVDKDKLVAELLKIVEELKK